MPMWQKHTQAIKTLDDGKLIWRNLFISQRAHNYAPFQLKHQPVSKGKGKF
jgi:hypothetical protein